jgi:hypothetical protein
MLSHNEFRVFDLLPFIVDGDSHHMLRGQTRVLPLPTHESYETLSYVWGSHQEGVIIKVDGKNVKVTESLAAALRRLVLPDRPRTLWIDQLCIDQNDDTEKATQVPHMGQIYRGTKRCLIWMGEIQPDIELADAASALEFMTYMNDEAETRAQHLHLPSCMASPEAMVAPMEALRSIGWGQNPWWERIWTLQEAVLPSKALVLWGSLSITWNVLAGASRAASTPRSSPLSKRMYAPHVVALSSITTQVNGLVKAYHQSESPMHIAFRWKFRKATNPLDKVYGLLGLFPPGSLRLSSRPDYDLPAATLYAMFTVDLIECEKTLHPIVLWNSNHSPHSTPNIPNWAFDLSNKGDLAVHMTPVSSSGDDSIDWLSMNTYGWYNASASSEIIWDSFSFDGTTRLTLTGQRVNELRIIGAPLESSNSQTKHVTDQEVIQRIVDWHQQIGHAYRNGDWPDDSRGPSLWPNSFWRGLIGDVVGPSLHIQRHANEEDIATVQHFVNTGARALVCQVIFATVTYRTAALTASGLLTFCPRHSRIGDQIWLLDGGKMPFVLRPLMEEGKGEKRFMFIGPVYVDGVMDGEAWSDGMSEPVVLV